jgi:hypothetical protein
MKRKVHMNFMNFMKKFRALPYFLQRPLAASPDTLPVEGAILLVLVSIALLEIDEVIPVPLVVVQ